MGIKIRSGYFRYAKNSFHAIAKITLPGSGNGPFPVAIFAHGGATFEPGYDQLDYDVSTLGAELLSRGIAVVSMDYRPGGYGAILTSTTFHDKTEKVGEHLSSSQLFERAFFPNNLIHAAQIVQYLKSHATDEDLLGAGKSLHTDSIRYARIGYSSGSWMSGYVNYMPDGAFPYDTKATSTDGEFIYRFNHCADTFIDMGGQMSLSQFRHDINVAPENYYNTYGEYSWAGGYLFDANLLKSGVTWDTFPMQTKMAADWDNLIVADNPRVSQVATFSYRAVGEDYSYANIATALGVSQATAYAATRSSNVLNSWTPGVVDPYYFSLHAPKNQYWLHAKLKQILGANYNGAMKAGKTQATGGSNDDVTTAANGTAATIHLTIADFIEDRVTS
jgi:hypothetical protein